MQTKNENSLSDELNKKYLGFNLKLLRLGTLKLSLENTGKRNKIHPLKNFPLLYTNILALATALIQILHITHSLAQGRRTAAMQTCTNLFSSLLCVGKHLTLSTQTMKIEAAIQKVATVWRKYPPHNAYKKRILDEADETLFLCKLFVGIGVLCFICLALPPVPKFIYYNLHKEKFNYTYDYSQRVLFLEYPFKIDNTFSYISLVLEEQLLVCGCAVYWVLCDNLFAMVTVQIALQFKALRYDLDAFIKPGYTDDEMRKNLIVFVERHRELLSVCESFQKIFSPVILITIILSGLNMCVNVFEVNEAIAEEKYDETALYVSIFFLTLFQVVFYCVFAEKLTEQASLLANAVYNCKWTEVDHKYRFYFKMLMQRSQKPFYYTGYGFFPMGHNRLMMVLKTTFSYYMMVQTTS